MALDRKPEFLTQIRDLIFNHFDRGEFHELCFQLGVRHDDLREDTLSAQMREFLLHLERTNRLPDLLAYCSYARPKVDWPSPNEPITLDSSPSSFAAPARKPRQIFLSHAGADADFAHRLADDLRRHGWEIWIAPDTIQPGEEWVSAINNGLAASGIFLLVLTPDAVKSSWVYKETNVAINLQNQQLIRLIPLDVKPVNAPPLWQAYQWIPFQDVYKDGLEHLLQALQPEKLAQVAGLYRQMEHAMGRSDWDLTQKLGSQIKEIYPDYRETETLLLSAEREERRAQAQQAEAAQMYPRLQTALAAEEWATALTLADKIEALVPGYQDVAQLADHARQGQRQYQRAVRQQWLKRIPAWGWGGGVALVLVLLFFIFQWAGGRDDPNIPPVNAQLDTKWTRPKDGMVMVFVPPPEAPFELESGVEAPAEGYWIDKYEVSTAQYQLCVDAGACEPSTYANDDRFNGSEYPVVGVSWFDAAAYSQWVGGALPTEAEWEYAAVGETGSTYPWGDEFDVTLLNFCDTNCDAPWKDGDFDDGYVYTAPVGSYPAGESWVGAEDMAGNVWEWTGSWYDEDETRRVVRGGSWGNSANDARAAYRSFSTPDYRLNYFGFRVVVRRPPSS
jgi:formylglycine-generating enzyme required for sulfatase activity